MEYSELKSRFQQDLRAADDLEQFNMIINQLWRDSATAATYGSIVHHLLDKIIARYNEVNEIATETPKDFTPLILALLDQGNPLQRKQLIAKIKQEYPEFIEDLQKILMTLYEALGQETAV